MATDHVIDKKAERRERRLAYTRGWRARNRDHIQAYNKRYRTDPENIIKAALRDKDPVRVARALSITQRWREKNREALRAKSREAWRNNPERRRKHAESSKIRLAVKRDEINKKKKAWREANAAKIREYNIAYRSQNLDKLLNRERRYHHANKLKRNEYSAKYWVNRVQTDIEFRIAAYIRNRLNGALKRGTKGGSAIRDLGCTIEEFRSHISSLFVAGMTWDTWGPMGWHLDHIKPLSGFDLTDRAQFLEACHWTNYQPLWSTENIRKGGVKARALRP